MASVPEPAPRASRGDPDPSRGAWILSALAHGAVLAAVLLYSAFPTRETSKVAVFELVTPEAPKLRPLAPKTVEPPPPKKIEARAPEAPKLTAKPKPSAKPRTPEPKTVKAPNPDTTLPIKETPRENSTPAPSVVSNVPSDTRLAFWASRMQKKVEVFWNPPTGIDAEAKAKTVIGFTINRDGEISNLEVVKSSGNAILDEQARRAIRLMGRGIPIPPNYPEDVLKVSYEFIYQGQ